MSSVDFCQFDLEISQKEAKKKAAEEEESTTKGGLSLIRMTNLNRFVFMLGLSRGQCIDPSKMRD